MKQAEAYLRAVRRGLADAPEEDRERLMKRLTEAVSAYLEEEPEAGEADIVRAFGKPEDCAAELLEECGVRLPLARQAVLAAQARGWQLPAPGLSALTLAEAAAALKGAKMTAGQKVGEEFGR